MGLFQPLSEFPYSYLGSNTAPPVAGRILASGLRNGNVGNRNYVNAAFQQDKFLPLKVLPITLILEIRYKI